MKSRLLEWSWSEIAPLGRETVGVHRAARTGQTAPREVVKRHCRTQPAVQRGPDAKTLALKVRPAAPGRLGWGGPAGIERADSERADRLGEGGPRLGQG